MIPVVSQLHGFFRSLGDIRTDARCSTHQPTTPVAFGSLSSITLSQFTFLTHSSVSSILVRFSSPLSLNILPSDDAMGISFTAKVAPGSSEWYGELQVSNIQLDSKPVTVNNWLIVSFNVPTKNFTKIDSWENFGASVSSYINTKEIDSSTIQVTVYLQFSSPWTFNPANILSFGVNGDMSNPKEVENSVILTMDPSGTVNIQFVDLPDDLVGTGQVLTFTDGALVIQTTVKAGPPSSFQIVPSTFIVSAAELTNDDQTLVATSQVFPSTISVENGKVTALKVTYTDVKHFSAIDVIISDISPLQNEQLYGTVTSSVGKLTNFTISTNQRLTLYRLPQSGTLDIGIGTITINNVPYSFTTQSVDASAKPHQAVTFQKAVPGQPIIPPDSVKLPIEVKTEVASDATFTVQLRLLPDNYIYKQQLKANAGTTDFAAVAPGNYTVQVSGFVHNFTVYNPEAPSTLTVEKDGTTKLTLQFNTGANLKVPGFPNFLSFGGCTTGDINEAGDFEYARASSIFKYAGNGGDGDPTVDLPRDLSTINTIKLAGKIGKDLKTQALPVMISYTCNFSGGGTGNLGNPEQLAHSFGNLIVSLIDANETIKGLEDPSSVVAVGYIVNPDFLGECQKYQPDPSAPKGLSPDFPVKVSQALTIALKTRGISVDIPASIKDTLSGYVLAVNWLLRTIPLTLNFGFIVTFGWQVNLWGSGSAVWIYGETDPAIIAQTTVDYIKTLSLYNGPYYPDFLAVDRYERDDFTIEAQDYRFGPHEWPRFFGFCKAFSLSLKVPVMPWQIPASHVPLINDPVVNIEKEHWGTGGSYILGDKGLGSDYHNINPKILAYRFNRTLVRYKTVEDLFARQPFDWSKPAYRDFPLRGIFAVLLGGGSTTGIVSNIGNPGNFVRDRLRAYMEHPISTDDFNT